MARPVTAIRASVPGGAVPTASDWLLRVARDEPGPSDWLLRVARDEPGPSDWPISAGGVTAA